MFSVEFVQGQLDREAERELLLTAHDLTYEMRLAQYVRTEVVVASHRALLPDEATPSRVYGVVKLDLVLEYGHTYSRTSNFAPERLFRHVSPNLVDESSGWEVDKSERDVLYDHHRQVALICDHWMNWLNQLKPRHPNVRRLLESFEELRAVA
jgi:hypothetical protein